MRRAGLCLFALLGLVLLAPCQFAEQAGEVGVDGRGAVGAAGPASRRLVLGAEYNIAEGELRIFLASLRGSGCRANVVLFCGRPQAHTERLAERFGATLIHYDFATLNRTHGPVGVHRFHLYRRFLEERRGHYDLVLHTDVRDVMFQDDPFERIEAHGGGVFFLESNHLLIGTSPTNRGWMTENCTVYSQEKMLERTAHRLRCCSGNMFGTSDAVYWYARLMEEEQQRTSDAERDADGHVLARGWCADQAVHQALLWTGQFSAKMHNVTTYQNEDGPLCAMGDVLSISVDEYGDVKNIHGELYAVVHQYDRHKRVRDTIAARYTDDLDADTNLHPSFVPDYKDRILYGDPSKLVRHENVDLSLPDTLPDISLPDALPPSLPADSSVKTCKTEACAAAAVAEVAAATEASSSSSRRSSSELIAHWQQVIARAPSAEAAHVQALAALALKQGPAYEEYEPARFQGRGVVMAGGGRLQIVNAYCVVRVLRQYGCQLPVELYYAGTSEMSAEVVEVFNDLDVLVLDIYHSLQGADAEVPLRGFQIKAFAVLHSSFEEVLWLDTDAVPAGNLSLSFESAIYNTHGSLFWQDWSCDPHWLSADFMQAYGLMMEEGERELEAGQFVLSKRRAWLPLQMVVHMNRHFDHFYRRLYGDKDTWRLAFKMADMAQGLAPFAADVLGDSDPSGRRCGNTMMHKDEMGNAFTFHRTLQTLPSMSTPLPARFSVLSDAQLEEAASQITRRWRWRSRQGLQKIVPRLNDSAAGWRVEKEEVDDSGHMHWCLYIDSDTDVQIHEVEHEILNLEASLRAYMRELAAFRVMDTVGASIVT